MYNSVRAAMAALVLSGTVGAAAFAQDATEARISNNVLAQINQDAALHADQLHVETIGNTVYLRGTVDSTLESQDAEQIARSVPQVTQVVNELSYSAN